MVPTFASQGHSEWKKLKNGPPECLEYLEVMFENVVVDGSSARAPGEHIAEEENGGDDGCNRSPMNTTTLKRGGTTASTASSPKKRIKSPMVKIMKGIMETMQANSVVAQKVMQGELRAESIQKAMQLAVDSGAVEGSVEHFMATQLLAKAENCDVLFTFTTNEGRLAWLKRWCQKENLY